MLLAVESTVGSTLKPRSDAATMARAVLRSRLALRCQDGSASRGVVEDESCKVRRADAQRTIQQGISNGVIDGYKRAANKVAVVKLRRRRKRGHYDVKMNNNATGFVPKTYRA